MYESDSSSAETPTHNRGESLALKNNNTNHTRTVSISLKKDVYISQPVRRSSSDSPYMTHGSSKRAQSAGMRQIRSFDERPLENSGYSSLRGKRTSKERRSKKLRKKDRKDPAAPSLQRTNSKRRNKRREESFDSLDLVFSYPKDQMSNADLIHLAVNMLTHHHPLTIMNRRWHMRSYKRCFVASEFVDWIVKYQKKTRKEGVELGVKMVMENIFHHVADREGFDDGFYFFRFTKDAISYFPPHVQAYFVKQKRSLSLSRMFKKKHAKIRLRVLLLGLDSAGKTTITYRLKSGKVANTVPTIGFNVETIKHKKVEINLWDVGGQDRLRRQWRHHYQGTSGILFVVDSNDTARVQQARDELHCLMQEDELKSSCICILANKQDLPQAMNSDDLEEELHLNELANDHCIFATNAKTGDGLEEALDWLCMTMKPF